MSSLPRAHAHRSESVAFTAAFPMPLVRQLVRSFSLDILTPACATWRTCRSVSKRAAACAQAFPPTSFCSSKGLIDRVGTEFRTDSTYTVARENNLGPFQTRL
jgi:hypothetical protein